VKSIQVKLKYVILQTKYQTAEILINNPEKFERVAEILNKTAVK
jgi:hypothetical protein